jgi:DUF1016 N-terminal domain
MKRQRTRHNLYQRIRTILESARAGVARTVNTTQVVANWLVGREIVEEEQRGRKKAGYGERVLAELSEKLQAEFGRGYSVDNIELFRRFYLEFPALAQTPISEATRRILDSRQISDALRRKTARSLTRLPKGIGYTVRDESWKPGRLHPNLSWTHYRALLRVDHSEVRAFYGIEANRRFLQAATNSTCPPRPS